MATIKSFISLDQSKVLAEILPLESADMFYNEEPEDESYPKDIVDTKYPMVLREEQKRFLEEYGIPCWSLAALLDILQYPTLFQRTDRKWDCTVWIDFTKPYSIEAEDNPVDACVAMIEKSHELNLF